MDLKSLDSVYLKDLFLKFFIGFNIDFFDQNNFLFYNFTIKAELLSKMIQRKVF